MHLTAIAFLLLLCPLDVYPASTAVWTIPIAKPQIQQQMHQKHAPAPKQRQTNLWASSMGAGGGIGMMSAASGDDCSTEVTEDAVRAATYRERRNGNLEYNTLSEWDLAAIMGLYEHGLRCLHKLAEDQQHPAKKTLLWRLIVSGKILFGMMTTRIAQVHGHMNYNDATLASRIGMWCQELYSFELVGKTLPPEYVMMCYSPPTPGVLFVPGVTHVHDTSQTTAKVPSQTKGYARYNSV